MKALDKQVGGDHYKGLKIQPVEYIHANNLGFLEGNIVKYVTRHASKGGRADIEKVIHYAELLLAMEYPEAKVVPCDHEWVNDMHGEGLSHCMKCPTVKLAPTQRAVKEDCLHEAYPFTDDGRCGNCKKQVV